VANTSPPVRPRDVKEPTNAPLTKIKKNRQIFYNTAHLYILSYLIKSKNLGVGPREKHSHGEKTQHCAIGNAAKAESHLLKAKLKSSHDFNKFMNL